MPKRILVTGGAGFIGSHVTEALVREGHAVTIFDNFSSGLRENFSSVTSDVRVVEGDVRDLDALLAAAKGHDQISHQAAQLEITKCIEDPLGDLETNLLGTLNVLKAARDISAERVVNASSACIYGQAVNPPSREDESPHNPNWSYGASKLAAEKYAQVFSQDYGFPVFSLRYGIVYGAREWYGRALTIFLKRALDKKPPVVFGEGSQVRDFTYVGDVVKLNVACHTTDLRGAHSFNGGTGVATSIAELARLVCDVTGLGTGPLYESIKPGERSELVDGRLRLPAELEAMQLSPDKAKRLLGVDFATPLRDGLAMEWDWLQANPGRWTEMHY